MRTTNEPGRRQNSEVNTPNRPNLARHLLRTHIRSHVDQTRQEYSRTYGRGHRLTPTQARGPTRANTALEPKGYSLIRFQDTNGLASKGFFLNRSLPYDLQAIIRLSRHPATIHASFREPTHQGYYSSEVCQIEGAETSKPRQRTGLKSIGLTDLFT